MALYDIIVGTKLDKIHNNILYYEREEMDNPTKKDLYFKLYDAINKTFMNMIEIPGREDASRILSMIDSRIIGNDITLTEDDYTFLEQAFNAIAYLGIDGYVLRRDDATIPTTEPKNIRAFLISTRLENTDPRIASALGISSDENIFGSISNVTMESYRSKVRINPSLEEVLKINTEIENWEKLDSVGAGSAYDCMDLFNLLEDSGYKVKIFIL